VVVQLRGSDPISPQDRNASNEITAPAAQICVLLADMRRGDFDHGERDLALTRPDKRTKNLLPQEARPADSRCGALLFLLQSKQYAA
jgi:hypothetical protein